MPARQVSTRSIQVTIDNYFQRGTVTQAGYPIEMALWQPVRGVAGMR